jgi:p-hydroxybenzoate 3-monooxygenase
MELQEKTTVAIIGAGVAGLTLATFLHQAGVACVVLERHNRAYLEQRQRADVVEARGVQMFERWGLAEQLLGGPVAQTIDYRLNGVSHLFTITGDEGSQGRFCTQQMLVLNLLRELLDGRAGDVRFDAAELAIQYADSAQPHVRYTDTMGTHELACDYVVGCDGSRGTSRAAIPAGVLTTHSYEFGYAWLAALVEAPVTGHPIMGVSDYGFVGQLPRGPYCSRYYLQCALSDTAEDWPDERLWQEIRRRTDDETIQPVAVHDKFFVPLRSVVHAPMQYGRLFLAGDAAHLVPPASAKGMNLALYDVDVLAQALRSAVRDQDPTALQQYSDTCLTRVWKYQEFALDMTNMLHDAGDATQHGPFRQQVARAQLAALFTSPTAALLHSEYQRGTF